MTKNATVSRVEEKASVVTTTERQFSPAEIANAQAERDRLGLQLENAVDALQKREDELARIEDAERKAKRILAMTQPQQGFESERRRAEEVLAHCAQRRAEVLPLVENRRRYVQEVKAQLARLPSAALRQQDTIRALAQELSAPLP
jgi:hypothetical protein